MNQSEATRIPARISRLSEFATNISWTWRIDARQLFRTLDLSLWRRTRHNPIEQLVRVPRHRLDACAEDPSFLDRYDRVCESVDSAGSAPTWFSDTFPDTQGPVAYFCAEFALHQSIPTYSGGLGVLAGDHLKAASDLGVPMVGVGLMYAHGYFDQTLRSDGWQEDGDEALDSTATPLERVRGADGTRWIAWLHLARRRIYVGAWRLRVGRVVLYLLDSDLRENDPEDRGLSHQLYAGGVDHRLRQELLLGVGGVRVLRSLGIRPHAWHANEGHATFMMVERVRRFVSEGTPFDEAVRRVRSNSVFTTHTPVPAGHDVFSHDQMRAWAGEEFLRRTADEKRMLALGAPPEDAGSEQFHMTSAAIRLSSRVNGVSARHGRVTRDIWRGLWKGREAEDVPISHVTNGVHLGTWMNSGFVRLLADATGSQWLSDVADPRVWQCVMNIPLGRLWAEHMRLKHSLIDFMREEARHRWRDHWAESSHLVGAGTLLSPTPLTIGFARRFATYKRADLLFRNTDRLLALLSNPRRPVQIIFAGKAHPRDEAGKRILQAVYKHTRDPEFEGRVAFLENYGLHKAHRLVEGVDLWLNIPRVPLEASGTSGMKAALNGVPQLATIDGWWEEGFEGDNGWAIPKAPEGMEEEEIDEHDHEHLFRLLEDEVVPLFYGRYPNGLEEGLPKAWIKTAMRAMEVAGRRFTAGRMVRDYAEDYYVPALDGSVEDHDPPG